MADPSSRIPDYYSQRSAPSLAAKFRNFDDGAVYARYESYAKASNSRNFVIDFGQDEAWAAFDLDLREWDVLLRTERPISLNTRWINIWAPNKQKDVVKALAARYDLSPRLLALMCSEPLKPVPIHSPNKSRLRNLRQSFQQAHRKSMTITEDSDDLEEQVELVEVDTSMATDSTLDLNHYGFVDVVWHYNSVDWGDHYLCLGYNSLHNVSINGSTVPNSGSRRDLPHGKRLWTWLMLCNDGTVVTINEDPFPVQGSNFEHQQEALIIIRRNMLNVFRQLSKVNHTGLNENPLSILPIRRTVQSSPSIDTRSGGVSQPSDIPSLLFYYLFDDWYTTYSIVTRKQHKYAAKLSELRGLFLEKPALEHVAELHHVGRQLAVLKRMYESYDTIIERILERKKASDPRSGATSRSKVNNVLTRVNSTNSPTNRQSLVTSDLAVEELSGLHAALSPAAIVRFERLKDRISLYALNEIQDCLDEKESLTIMNFNLIGIKESQYVERLTRITILLAKVTILFLPVSLMTGYFSVQIKDLEGVYSWRTYWGCFGVIMVLSILLLFFFGKASDTLEGAPVYKSITRTTLDVFRRVTGQRKKKSR